MGYFGVLNATASLLHLVVRQHGWHSFRSSAKTYSNGLSRRETPMADIMPRTPSELLQMLSRMDRLFDRPSFDQEEGTLALDIYEQDDALIVEASVPGFTREDIDVQLHQGLLSIVAQRLAQDGTAEGRRYYRQERPMGAWTRRIALPGVVHDAEVDATMKDGVLTLRIPIPAAAKPRRIEIRSHAGGGNTIEGATDAAQSEVMKGIAEHTAAEPAGAALN